MAKRKKCKYCGVRYSVDDFCRIMQAEGASSSQLKPDERSSNEDTSDLLSDRKVVICMFCDEKCKSFEELLSHGSAHFPVAEPNFQCNECPETFAKKCELNYRKKSYHNPYAWSYTCKICDLKFSRRARLLQHRRLHAKQLCNYPCPFGCEKTFLCICSTTLHVYVKHEF